MAKLYDKITLRFQRFIEAQKIFFVPTAPENSGINLSPKGIDSLRIVDKNTILWLNVPGSGHETATHLLKNNRITMMFYSFERVQTSFGMSIPFFDYKGERDELNNWATEQGK
jgi:hypothetical protein